jgi:hypothetical protein
VHSLRIRTDNHFHLLTVLPIETCVFPRLLALDWGHSKGTKHLQLFLSPALRHCVLPVITSNLKSTCCPVLRSLSILLSHTADELSLLYDTVRSCKQLVDLSCTHLDFATWKHLSNLPTLLKVAIQEYDVSHPIQWENLDFAPFLNLTTLVFDVEESADIITIMERSEFPSLRQFKMHVGELSCAKTEQLFRALSLCKACGTLENIDISSNYRVDEEEEEKPLTVLRQCLSFSQLRTLRLSVYCPIYLDNDLLLEAMSSWEHICHLQLEDSCFLIPPTVTFRGLFEALHLRPHLHTLGVSMDAVNIDIVPTAESFQHTSLRVLDICTSRINNPQAVARIIFSMLPLIRSVTIEGDEDEDEDEDYTYLWLQVNTLLRRFLLASPKFATDAEEFNYRLHWLTEQNSVSEPTYDPEW